MSQSAELSNLLSTIKSVDQDSFTNENERHTAIAEARKLVARLEKPWDKLLHMTWGIDSATAGLKICADLDVFKHLDSPKTTDELAKVTGAEEAILNRHLRHLASENLVEEVGPSTYANTPTTREIAHGTGLSAIQFMYDLGWVVKLTWPEYLRKTQYKVPTNAADGNLQYATNTSVPMFGPGGWLASNPEAGQNFSKLMVGYTSQRQKWVEVFPTERLLDGAAGDETLVVDMGGNVGEDLGYLIQKHPETSGRLVLQDIDEIINQPGITFPDGIKATVHDFRTPQPVKNARAYFFHSIFHDWPDADCITICENLRPSMGPNSRLLISDMVIKPTGNASHQTSLDVLMMEFLASSERTEQQWHDLLGKGGFKIVQIHPGRLESVIEAVPA